MRLNRNTYPAYFYFIDQSLKPIYAATLDEDDVQISHWLTSTPEKAIKALKVIAKCCESFRFDVNDSKFESYKLTQPFLNALGKASQKIPYPNIEIKTQKRGVIFGTTNTFTVYYINPTSNDIDVATRSNELVYLFAAIFNRTTLLSYVICYKDGEVDGDFGKLNDVMVEGTTLTLKEFYFKNLCDVLYFIENCEIDVKVVAPNQKLKDRGVKYYNESMKPLIILDCNWFTELIRTTPFTVDGFFRWQPHGEKRLKKKLIWIESFEKHGYHRQASKLLHADEK